MAWRKTRCEPPLILAHDGAVGLGLPPVPTPGLNWVDTRSRTQALGVQWTQGKTQRRTRLSVAAAAPWTGRGESPSVVGGGWRAWATRSPHPLLSLPPPLLHLHCPPSPQNRASATALTGTARPGQAPQRPSVCCFTAGGPGKEHRTGKPPPTRRVQERSKGDASFPTNLPESSSLESTMAEQCVHHQEGPWVTVISQRQPQTIPSP